MSRPSLVEGQKAPVRSVYAEGSVWSLSRMPRAKDKPPTSHMSILCSTSRLCSTHVAHPPKRATDTPSRSFTDPSPKVSCMGYLKHNSAAAHRRGPPGFRALVKTRAEVLSRSRLLRTRVVALDWLACRCCRSHFHRLAETARRVAAENAQ